MTPREDAPVDRDHTRQDLLHHARRLAQHTKHLSVAELRALDELVDQLAALHTDDTKCANLARRHQDKVPPWGARYAPWWERAWYTVFPPKN